MRYKKEALERLIIVLLVSKLEVILLIHVIKMGTMSVANQIQKFTKELNGTNTKLVAVSKTKPVALIQEAYEVGQRIFGENKVQELVEKYEELPKDIEWHMIGHLQRNKVKYIAPFVSLIHGVDTLKLLKEINKEGKKNNRVIPCLLQVHIAQEETKFGFDTSEIITMATSAELKSFTHVSISGLMGMATNTSDTQQIKKEFEGLKSLSDELQSDYLEQLPHCSEISMGMSGDYQIAVATSSTMIRVGSTIFGARNYSK